MLTDAGVVDRGVLRIKALVFAAIFTFLLTQKVLPPSCFSAQLIWKAGCFLGYQRIKKTQDGVQFQLAKTTEGSSKGRTPLGSSCRYSRPTRTHRSYFMSEKRNVSFQSVFFQEPLAPRRENLPDCHVNLSDDANFI